MSPSGLFALIVAAGATDPAPLHFSTEIDFTATAGPHTGQVVTNGDELHTGGFIINVWTDLIGRFCPKPVFPNFGLDALHRRGDGTILFSTEDGWFDECLGVQISGGDLLRIDPGNPLGSVERTNLDLLAPFVLKPVPADVGLDAVVELPDGELWFSTEQDDFSTALGVTLSNGDLLSDQGTIVRTNAQLLQSFCIMPIVPDLGLDAVMVPGNGEIWFSTEDGFFDECLGVQVSDGDLLSDAGYVVATNQQLLFGFVGAGTVASVGLDAAWGPAELFSGCGLIDVGPQGCPIFRPVNDVASFLFIENLGPFSFGDLVFVEGLLNPSSFLCGPFIAPGIENNTIEPCFSKCGIFQFGPQGCPIIVPDDGSGFVFVENAGNFGDFAFGDRVLVRGRFDPDSLICPPFTAPGVEDNTIEPCFAGCGALAPGPQGCTIFIPADGSPFFFIENTGGFPTGVPVFVNGRIDPTSTLCPPLVAPGIVDNVICPCFDDCGVLVQTADCLVLQTPNGFFQVENTGLFEAGDRVHVFGCFDPECPSICLPNLFGCVTGNVIRACEADLDSDCEVSVVDLLILLANWGPCDMVDPPCIGDIDGNGEVNTVDLLILLAAWGPCPS